MPTSAQFLPAKVVTLPSGRTIVLKSIDSAKAAALVPSGLASLDQTALRTAMISKSISEPQFLAAMIQFLLTEGVHEPRIVNKSAVDDLLPGEIRFQDVGSDLLSLLEAIGAYNQHLELADLLRKV